MQAKYVLGLILVLQVSLSLCQQPTPSAPLVQKYMELRAKLLKRFETAFQKFKESLGLPMDALNGEVFEKFLEAEPEWDQARSTMLKMYEDYLRSYFGKFLDDGINMIQPFLDSIMPTE